jgi:NAD(P)-dependent dehydrogenase (short-subunit alcohol dehydrogenase family)
MANDDGRVVVITGGSKGFGKSIAEEFAMNGYCVLINSLDEQELKIATKDISNIICDNKRVAYFPGDVSQESFCESLLDNAMQQFGRVDVLINNGRISVEPKKIYGEGSRPESNTQVSPYFVLEEFERINPKMKGVYFCIKAAVKRMMIGNRTNCSIINISSCQGCIAQSAATSYTESRSGVDPYTDSMASIETITKSVALELAGSGIRVNGIIPGLVTTDLCEDLIENEQKRHQKEMEIPIRRIAKPHEISKVALFLASEDASYITGAMIPVDGGLVLSKPNYFVEIN